MAYKRDNMIYGSLDNSYVDSMDESVDNNQDALRWKALANQAIKDDSMNSTNEGDAYRQKELLAVRARKKKIVQEIDELKKELQQRTQLQAYEDRYKDSPVWKLAKKQYIDTGDMGSIESFVTRENALEEAEKNRQNTLLINRAQKDEQLEYNLDDAQEKVELAQNKLKKTKALRIPSDIKDAQISFNAAVKRLNKFREQKGMGDSDYVLEEYEEYGKKEYDNTVRSVDDIIYSLPDKYIYDTEAEKDKIIAEIEAHPAFTENNDERLIKALSNIKKTKTREKRKAENAEAEAKAQATWDGLEKLDREAYQDEDEEIIYDNTNPEHRVLKPFTAKFRIKWGK